MVLVLAAKEGGRCVGWILSLVKMPCIPNGKIVSAACLARPGGAPPAACCFNRCACDKREGEDTKLPSMH